MRAALSFLGVAFREHAADLPGTPDFALDVPKVAVFVDGDFWHGRPWFESGRAPKANRAAWLRKFGRNRRRDRRADSELLRMGWLPLRFWGSDVDRKALRCALVVRLLASRGVEDFEPHVSRD